VHQGRSVSSHLLWVLHGGGDDAIEWNLDVVAGSGSLQAWQGLVFSGQSAATAKKHMVLQPPGTALHCQKDSRGVSLALVCQESLAHSGQCCHLHTAGWSTPCALVQQLGAAPSFSGALLCCSGPREPSQQELLIMSCRRGKVKSAQVSRGLQSNTQCSVHATLGKEGGTLSLGSRSAGASSPKVSHWLELVQLAGCQQQSESGPPGPSGSTPGSHLPEMGHPQVAASVGRREKAFS